MHSPHIFVQINQHTHTHTHMTTILFHINMNHLIPINFLSIFSLIPNHFWWYYRPLMTVLRRDGDCDGGPSLYKLWKALMFVVITQFPGDLILIHKYTHTYIHTKYDTYTWIKYNLQLTVNHYDNWKKSLIEIWGINLLLCVREKDLWFCNESHNGLEKICT